MARWRATFPSVWTMLCLGSLLLAGAMVALGIRSYWVRESLGYSTGDARFTFWLERGRLRVMGPPRPGSAQAEADAKQFAEILRNDQVVWSAIFDRDESDSTCLLTGLSASKSAAWNLYDAGEPRKHFRSWRPLLAALDDPGRFVAAHYWLSISLDRNHDPRVPVTPVQANGERALRVEWLGLGLELYPGRAEREQANPTAPTRLLHSAADSWRPLPGTRESVRDAWHKRLDSEVGELPYWPGVGPMLILPMVWAGMLLRRVRRRRRGQCVRCGYDLRASPERCSECGLPLKSGLAS